LGLPRRAHRSARGRAAGRRHTQRARRRWLAARQRRGAAGRAPISVLLFRSRRTLGARRTRKETAAMPIVNGSPNTSPTSAINSAMRGVSLIVPTVIESGTRGERAYDLFSRLLRERIVLVNGPIEDQMANLIVAELLFLASESSEREINMYIS